MKISERMILMSEHNNFYNVREAKLNAKVTMQNILHIRDIESISAEDRRLWDKITRLMDGEVAFVHKSRSNPDAYLFLGLKNELKNRELFYLMEQDSRMGSYYNDRERFEKDWNSGEYRLDGNICLGSENVVFED